MDPTEQVGFEKPPQLKELQNVQWLAVKSVCHEKALSLHTVNNGDGNGHIYWLDFMTLLEVLNNMMQLFQYNGYFIYIITKDFEICLSWLPNIFGVCLDILSLTRVKANKSNK